MKEVIKNILLFFGICPCGGKIISWSTKKHYCDKCDKVY